MHIFKQDFFYAANKMENTDTLESNRGGTRLNIFDMEIVADSVGIRT